MSNFLLKINKVNFKPGSEIRHTKDINIPDRQCKRSSENYDSFSVKSQSSNVIYTVDNIQKAYIFSTCVNKCNGVSCAFYESIYLQWCCKNMQAYTCRSSSVITGKEFNLQPKRETYFTWDDIFIWWQMGLKKSRHILIPHLKRKISRKT